MMWYLKELGVSIFDSKYIIILIEATNFVLILAFKYGCLKQNFSKVLKEKLNIEIGDSVEP